MSRATVAGRMRRAPHLWALLSDTHMSEDTARAPHGPNIAGNLRLVVQHLLALPTRPAGVLINGDCAHDVGLEGDYQQFAAPLRPLGDAWFPVHPTLGNHVGRRTFIEVLRSERVAVPGGTPARRRGRG